MPKDKPDETITEALLTLVDGKTERDPDKDSAGHDPYNHVPDAESEQSPDPE